MGAQNSQIAIFVVGRCLGILFSSSPWIKNPELQLEFQSSVSSRCINISGLCGHISYRIGSSQAYRPKLYVKLPRHLATLVKIQVGRVICTFFRELVSAPLQNVSRQSLQLADHGIDRSSSIVEKFTIGRGYVVLLVVTGKFHEFIRMKFLLTILLKVSQKFL